MDKEAMIEVKVRDDYTTWLETKAHVFNKKQMKQLGQDLKDKGVNIPQ